MTSVDVKNIKGEVVGSFDLDDRVFGVEPNRAVVHQAVVAQLANQRKGTADTKTRGEVRGGTHKMWRQKGTGRARQGDRRAPHWTGGGVVFGPPRKPCRLTTPAKPFPFEVPMTSTRSPCASIPTSMRSPRVTSSRSVTGTSRSTFTGGTPSLR